MVQPFLPNEADAFANRQASPEHIDFEILLLGYQGTGVISGCAISEDPITPDLTVDVAIGVVALNGSQIAVSEQLGNIITTGHATLGRVDLVSINSSGTVVITDGTPAAIDVAEAPGVPANSIPLAFVTVPTTDTTIEDEQIGDKRVFIGPSTPDVLTRYVTTVGSDTNDGLSWETAMLTVAFAVDSLPTDGSGGTLRHTGKVFIGAGTFNETVTIEWNADLEIIGNGTGGTAAGAADGTTVIRRDHSGDLFSYDVGVYTDWGHHLRMKSLTLNGNKANHPTVANLVTTLKAGFNTSFQDVMFNQSSGYGIQVVTAASNLYFFNCTGNGCDDSFLKADIPVSTNLFNVALFGTQIDECGTAPIHIDCSSSGDANVLMIYGLETESQSLHDQIIRVVTLDGDNPLYVIADGISAIRLDGNGDAVCKRIDAGGGPGTSWTLRNIHGSGYNLAYHDAKSGEVDHGVIAGDVVNVLFSGGSRGLQVGQTLLGLAGIGGPEGNVAAPLGSTYHRTDGDGAGFQKLADAPIAAQGTLTMDTIPGDGDTVTVDYKTYTFQTVLTDVEGNINIGGSLAQAKLNLVAAFVLSGVAGTDYALSMQGHNTVDIATFAADDAVLTARRPGTGGNSIVTTETFGPATNIFDAATLGTTTSGTVGNTGWWPLELKAREEGIDRTLGLGDGIINFTGGRIVTLPDNALLDGKSYLIRRDAGSTVTINRAGSDTFSDGDVQKTLDSAGAAIGIFSIGDGEWKIVGTEGTVGGS